MEKSTVIFLFMFILTIISCSSLTDFRIAAKTPGGSIIQTDGLIGEWLFSGNGNDTSGHGNNGAINGLVLTNDRFGNPNKCYFFNGSGEDLVIPGNLTLGGMSELSISAWVYISADKAEHTIIGSWGNDTNEFHMAILTGGAIRTGFCQSLGSSIDIDSSAGIIPLSQWYHLVCVYQGTTVSIYTNSSILTNYTIPSGPILESTNDLLIGYFNTGTPVSFGPGMIDDVRLYSKALNQAEINLLYHENGW